MNARLLSVRVKTYRDIQRNLSGIGKMPKKSKQSFWLEVETLVAQRVEKLFKDVLSEREAFDAWVEK